jgi:hypothetical protein
MPRISAFYGITILMHWDDHDPPHYHAVYGGYEAWVLIASGGILRGSLPGRARRLVRSWHHLHQLDLEDAWDKVRARQAPGTIAPLP